MPAKLPISILIPAKNEAGNIAACIASAQFADEIVVVDSSSTDGSPRLAEKLGAKVVNFSWNGSFPKKKNWALQNIAWKHEWIFILDADERISPELAQEIAQTIGHTTCAGYYINRRFWFLDGWIRHCGYYPSWNLRLFKHRAGRYEQLSGVEQTQSGDNEVHEHVILNGQAGRLKGEMDHYAFPDLTIWLEKHNRYSNWEAHALLDHRLSKARIPTGLTFELRCKRLLKQYSYRLPFRPSLRFCYHYFLRFGLLDGYRGYVLCRLLAFYEFLSIAKAREIIRAGKQPCK